MADLVRRDPRLPVRFSPPPIVSPALTLYELELESV
jgi:hypothetical protein